MALSDDQIQRQNPWWARSAWRNEDSHLERLKDQPIVFDADPLSNIALSKSGIHIVRGPRQVGKSTSMKRLVDRALADRFNRRQVIYLAVDLLEKQPTDDLYRTVVRAKEIAAVERNDRCLLLLDEITVVSNWQAAIKSLWDDGVISGDIVICTGSSAIDLRDGAAEKLPGRRGPGSDILVLPQSFGEVARALDPDLPELPNMDLAALASTDGRQLMREMQIYLPSLQSAMESYVRFGGLPASVAELIGGAKAPSNDAKRIMHDALAKELGRRGASTPAAHALLERVLRSLGSKTNWATMAREMDVKLGPQRRPSNKDQPDPGTLREYIELMADGYFLLITYFWRPGSQSNALSNDKKMYFYDPLLHEVASDYAPGLKDDFNARVENLIATHLLRRYEDTAQLLESPAEPQKLHVWATSSGGEIDFIAGPWRSRAALEVKYGKVKLSVGANVAKAHPNRPAVVVSLDQLELDHDPYVVIPAALVAWAIS